MLVGITIGTIYFINTIKNTPNLNIETITKKKSSKIYDNNDNLIKQLSMEDYENIRYEDLPDVFINALLSSEDIRYFLHEGIDIPRILSALKNDLLSFSLKEGASTITQQLIKNMMLTNTKSIERKIHEIYLSYKIEKLYNKKDILEFYCNFVCFDGINHGVQHASYKFFNKSVSKLTLPEAAMLVGIVNAPSAYSPINNPLKANERKNVVLHLMHKHGYISLSEKNNASLITTEDLIIKKQEKTDDDKLYKYQSYIDIVYSQILNKTGYDPYVMPMEIYTYMDSALQQEIDNMQENKSNSIKFNNDYQQLAATIINNNTGAIVACFGKRNYKGQKILNYAYDKLIQPASTIKIPLDYALAFEYLNYNSKQILNDIPTTYPNSSTYINNVDKTYMGQLTISDAIGYSRNTTAISTLNEVIKKIGINQVVDYLKEINLMDKGNFSYSYGLGGYTYGVSVTNLAAAYSMIARNGLYIEPLTVKKIKLLDGTNKEINFTPYSKKMLDDSTCYLLIDCLNQVMNDNIWNINECKPNGVNVYAKTGTTSFDKNMLIQNNYPSNASKDRWVASFTKDYSMAVWSGFDKYLKDQKTYFLSNTQSYNLVKKFSKIIYDKIATKNLSFDMPSSLIEVNVVKGSDLLATSNIDKKYVTKAIYKKQNAPSLYFCEPQITTKVEFDYFVIKDQINLIFNDKKTENKYNVIFDYEKIMGGKSIYVDVYKNGFYEKTIEANEKIVTIPLQSGYYEFIIYYKYNFGMLDGIKSSISIIYN